MGQTVCARLARSLDRAVGLEQEIAHGRGPRLPVDLDQRLQFAQMMGVAQRMADVGEPGVRLEAVVNRDAADEPLRHLAAFGRHAIVGQGPGGDGVQPLSLSGDAKAGFIEAANRRRRRKGGDVRRHRRERRSLAAHPIRHAVRAQTQRSEKIMHRFGGPILGNELMDVEINRRRSNALAVLRRRGDARGKLGFVSLPHAAQQ